MIRIVAVQKESNPEGEFILLQNQGSLRLQLRGHVVLSDAAIQASNLLYASHVFSDDVLIPAGMYVMLRTGHGESRWCKTRDGALVYYAFMGRDRSIWNEITGPVHVLSTQHSFTERREGLVLR